MKVRVLLLLLLVAAGADASVQEFTTSQGVRTLPHVESLLTEASAREATQAADNVLSELLLDVAASEQQRALLLAEASAIAQKQKAEQGAIDKTAARVETDAQARLESVRSDVQTRFAKHSLRQAQLYRQLRQCVAYTTSARAKLHAKVSQPLDNSAALDEANERLRVFGARSPK